MANRLEQKDNEGFNGLPREDRKVYEIPHFLRHSNDRFLREPDHDRRIGRGDDFAGDAWRDLRTGRIEYVAVGRNPNMPTPNADVTGLAPAQEVNHE